MPRIANLTCAVCDGSCKGRQWWNRDKGYGLCPSCLTWLETRGVSPEEIHHDYGVEGMHFFREDKP